MSHSPTSDQELARVQQQDPNQPNRPHPDRAQAEELEHLQDAALAIPDSEPSTLTCTNADAGARPLAHATSQPASLTTSSPTQLTCPLANAATVLPHDPSVEWSTILAFSSQGLSAATAVSSTGFALARGATAFGLNLAKRITQGLVAIPAMAVDGAVTGTVTGSNDATPSLAKLAHMTVGGFFDVISLVALGGIDVTSALTGAGLGAAGSGVEGLQRWMGSEVLRSLSEFSELVKREWNADDDALPPGGIPAYSVIGITQALTAWVCIQLVTREYQERRILKSLIEVDLDELKQQIIEDQRRESQQQTVPAPTSDATLIQVSDPATPVPSSTGTVRITSKETMSGEEGNIIGAEIGSKQEEGRSSFAVPLSSAARPLTNSEALRGLQRYSKLVLGVYGGLALAWLGILPSSEQATATTAAHGAPATSTTIFSAEEEFLSRDQADFLEAAAQMELPEEPDSSGEVLEPKPTSDTIGVSDDPSPSSLPGTYSSPADDKERPSGRQSGSTSSNTSFSYLDLLSGQHDNELFHRTANLERGTAREGTYDDVKARARPEEKARPSKPRYYVVTDHARKAIILVLRGSLSVGDIAADLTCESVPFSFHPSIEDAWHAAAAAQSSGVGRSDEDFCHEGMLLTAKEIGDVGRPVHRAVSQALRANDGYALEIAGHSLGAGVASLLAMMWGNPRTGKTYEASGLPAGRRIHSYCYAVPCVTSESLARKCATLVTSHVYSYDFVTRLSLGAIQDIRNGCAWLCYEDAEAPRSSASNPEWGARAGPRKMSWLICKAFEHQAGRLDPSDCEAKRQTEADFLSLRKTLEANMHGTHLFPPGKVLYSMPGSDLQGYKGARLSEARRNRDRLFVIDEKAGSLHNVFGQIVFSRNMLSCHMPSVYDRAIHGLPH
ncbi:hypothetical protein ACQY0O_000473 [Thecaphora frezii]